MREGEFDQAKSVVVRSGLDRAIEARLGRRIGARHRLTVLGFLVAQMLNGSRRGHRALVVEITKILNGLGPASLLRLDMPRWSQKGSYDRVQRLHSAIAAALDEGWDYVDDDGVTQRCGWDWFTTTFIRAAIDPEVLRALYGNVALAIDGTEMESCGDLKGSLETIDLDGDGPPPEELDLTSATNGKRRRRPKKAPVLGIGDDGRKIYTKDCDARAGWRTGNANHDPGKYIGREAHLGVAVRKLVNTDGVRWVKFGPDVPPVILAACVVPAGAHRARSILELALEAARAGLGDDDVLDAGYSMSRPEFLHYPMQRAGIGLTMRPAQVQRGEKPGVGAARHIDGHLFAAQLPDDLVELPAPPVGASGEEKLPYIAAFDRRAKYRYSRIKAPGTDGVTRWEHPVKAGTLRSRQVPRSMRNSTSAPLIELGPDADLRTVTAGADALPMWQPCLFGTTAWHEVMGRRQLVESVNSRLHGGGGSLTEISRGYTRLLDSGRIRLFFAATIAGLNRVISRQWLEDKARSMGRGQGVSGSGRRAPRKGRARRYEDPPALAGPDPPT